MIAALYVETGGVYYGLEDVDPWDKQRDARLYAGPWPVVAHPPCPSWSLMGNCRPGTRAAGDGGTFASALDAVREYGGVLEHPAHTRAWCAFGLARPSHRGWSRSLLDDGWTCEVDQGNYGHTFRKRTWLYYVGPSPPGLRFGPSGKPAAVGKHGRGGTGFGYSDGRRSKTPPAFRDVLLDMARSAGRVHA